MKNIFNSIFAPTGQNKGDVKKNLSNYISPVQLQRLRQDVTSWRAAIVEAEQAYFPHRVKMQQVYIDTILNGHVFSVMDRRKDLTLLREFKVCDKNGVESEDLTALFKTEWFDLLLSYSLDALFFGYSLISLGDIIDNEFNDLSIVRRWNVSPDRKEVTSFIYSPTGAKFEDPQYRDWHIWVPTASENGISNCGYGLFYKIALYEIFLRNTLGFNGDFVELYSQPYRVGKTSKVGAEDRADLEAALRNMGSSGFAVIDPMDSIEFLETALGGTGYKGYTDLEKRCQQTVSKIILGHADALDSIPGKLGANQGDESPVAKALRDKQAKDAKFIENIINKQVFKKLRNLGFDLPLEYHFEYKNDAEVEEYRKKEDASNLVTATIFKTIKDAGGKPDWKYFSERTGIDTTEAPVIKPAPPAPAPQKFSENVKNKLTKLYS